MADGARLESARMTFSLRYFSKCGIFKTVFLPPGFLLFLFLLLSASTSSSRVPAPTSDGHYQKWEKDGVCIQVHRIMRYLAPENTLAAAQACYEGGADVMECDIQLTVDGKAILFHDILPSEYGTPSPYPVTMLTWEEVREIPVHPLSYPKLNQKIPLFESLVRLAKANNIALYLDPRSSQAGIRAQEILKRYEADYLTDFPSWPYVCFIRDRIEHHIGKIQHALVQTTGKKLPGKIKTVLKPDDPRSFFLDDPRLVARVAGRQPHLRGGWRTPVPIRPDFTNPRIRHLDLVKGQASLAFHERRNATLTLCHSFPEQALKDFKKTLQLPEAATPQKIEALWGLGQLKLLKEAPLLRSHLGSKDPALVEAAAYSLGRLPIGPPCKALFKLASSPGKASVTAAWALWKRAGLSQGKEVWETLQQAIQHKGAGQETTLRLLLMTLGRLHYRPAVGWIVETFSQKKWTACVDVATVALGTIGGQKAVDGIVAFNRARKVRSVTLLCRALVVSGEEGVDALIEILRTGGNASFQALGATMHLIELPSVVPKIKKLVEENKIQAPEALCRVVSILYFRKEKAAVDLLKRLSEHWDPEVARQARWALEKK